MKKIRYSTIWLSLIHICHPAFAGVVVGDGERYALGEFVRADDDELSRQRRLCDARGMNPHQEDALGEFSFFEYLVHESDNG